ncbi:HNH endonuclease [Propionibacterium freudenreichii]|uniref:HNH endonuclease n=2 Tax=Propionibacterium freudenreichii TaxID=1744 RepID=UPI00279E46F8|nr:HNH endonuclease [Propionibacterium freudenreichii]
MSWADGATVRRLASLVVAEWGPVCWLCHGPIDLGAPRRSPRGLSLDHVVPRSLGGLDTLDNLRPAHLGCNCRRGNRVGSRPAPVRRDSRFFDRAAADLRSQSGLPPVPSGKTSDKGKCSR